jgi:hypothetical protein
MVATAVLLLLQVPEPEDTLSVAELKKHNHVVPVIGPAGDRTVSVFVEKQLPPME